MTKDIGSLIKQKFPKVEVQKFVSDIVSVSGEDSGVLVDFFIGKKDNSLYTDELNIYSSNNKPLNGSYELYYGLFVDRLTMMAESNGFKSFSVEYSNKQEKKVLKNLDFENGQGFTYTKKL